MNKSNDFNEAFNTPSSNDIKDLTKTQMLFERIYVLLIQLSRNVSKIDNYPNKEEIIKLIDSFQGLASEEKCELKRFIDSKTKNTVR